MMTGNVVPVDTIVVELVQDSETIFRSSTLNGLSVVRLWFADSKI
jgi:hypothetical protein